MNAWRDPRDLRLKLAQRGAGWGVRVPRWYLELRLRWTCAAIDRLERLLGDEFGVLETEPMHREMAALHAERDALLKRLG